MVVYGANLPLLVKLAKARRLPMREAVYCALTAGRKYINSVEGLGPDRLPIAL
jgi:PTS system mannose-specific IIA component